MCVYITVEKTTEQRSVLIIFHLITAQMLSKCNISDVIQKNADTKNKNIIYKNCVETSVYIYRVTTLQTM